MLDVGFGMGCNDRKKFCKSGIYLWVVGDLKVNCLVLDEFDLQSSSSPQVIAMI